VFDCVFTANDTAGINISELNKLSNGVYLIEATCKDKSGIEVKDIKYTTLYSAGENESTPVNTPDWYEAIKSVVEPGDKSSFIMASAHKDVNYFLQVERDKKIVTRKSMPANMKAFEIPITEDMRGNLVCHISFIKNNRYYYHQQIITVPFSNKDLEVYTETFRNKLLPGQNEEWKVVIKNKKGGKETAELLASMYDASLDAFVPHYWSTYFFPSYYAQIYQQTNLENVASSYSYHYNLNEYYYPTIRAYDELNDFDALNSYYNRYSYRSGNGKRMRKSATKYAESEVMADEAAEEKSVSQKEVNAPAATGATADNISLGGKASGEYMKKNKDKSGGDDGDGYMDATTTATTRDPQGKGNKETVQKRKKFLKKDKAE